ncbi:MAG: exodeoxyribonuclease III [Candidatus Obscuribacterales bacterium]|jgi:exodeoxyribonuclease-3
MLIASWNVNSITVRLPHLLDWLKSTSPDHVCLQELKTVEEKFPFAQLSEIGYSAHVVGEKTYNGVAILSKSTVECVGKVLPGSPEPLQSRLIEVCVDGVYILNLYVPNGSEVGSTKYEYKLAWFKALISYIEERHVQNGVVSDKLVICGDFNIAPEDRDVHDPAEWVGQVLVSEPERDCLRQLFNLGMIDSFREFEQGAGHFSWWDYRMMAFRRKRGMRIDHILVSTPLREALKRSWIDIEPRKLEKPSDHAPVIAEFEI